MTQLMSAAVLNPDAEKVDIEQIPVPSPRAGEVLVKVAGCGICHSDLSVVRGHIPFPRPCVIGHEVSGVVVELGPGVRDAPQPGTAVVCGFVMPCGSCDRCGEGRDDLCRNFFGMNRTHGTLYDGTSRLRRADGETLAMFSMSGMAEYAVVPATDVFALPEGLDVADASIIGCAAFTAFGAVRHGAALQVGETAAVFAVGGVGLNLVQLAIAHGAETVIAVDLAADKLAAASDAGATHTVDASTVDPVEAIKDLTGDGVDVAFEALGHPSTFRQAIDVVRDGGRMVPVGLSTQEALVPINKVVRSRVAIRGSYGGRTRKDMPDLLRLVARGHARPESMISRRVGLEDLNTTLEALERSEIVGRAVVTMPGT